MLPSHPKTSAGSQLGFAMIVRVVHVITVMLCSHKLDVGVEACCISPWAAGIWQAISADMQPDIRCNKVLKYLVCVCRVEAYRWGVSCVGELPRGHGSRGQAGHQVLRCIPNCAALVLLSMDQLLTVTCTYANYTPSRFYVKCCGCAQQHDSMSKTDA